ncbi:unnamed protein product [Enterobius vermicularis]|uniref:RING finger protein 113A n=1 Tax=Enterobius vermicularis TaxID=51028 RepID=A0A0N4VAB7_ENTVE|nr:unnamed protein product [Enterobius vermicularis]
MAEGVSSSAPLFRVRNRRGQQGAIRQKNKSESSEEESGPLVKTGVKRRIRNNPMVQSTNKKKLLTKRRSSSSSSVEEEDEVSQKDIVGEFKSSGTADRAGPSDMGATATSEIDTEADRDAQAQFERVQAALKDGTDDKVYRGAAMYGAKEKKDTARGKASSGLNRIGPIRAPNFLRQSVRWDFAPDICKDYKETGFCTFGDSCKFMHDRTDYKHGWEIERDYEAGRMKEDDDDKYVIHSSDEEEDSAELPFKCFICRDSFKNPVVTKCKHYFCERCALEHFQRTQKCFVCDQNTMGVFNVAKGGSNFEGGNEASVGDSVVVKTEMDNETFITAKNEAEEFTTIKGELEIKKENLLPDDSDDV